MGCPDVSGMAGGMGIMKVIVLGGYAESLINFRGHLLAKMVKNGHEDRKSVV